MNSRITFIGGGNMTTSLVGGLLANHYPADLITIAEPDAEKLNQLAQQFKINTTTDNNQAVASADVVVLAVKPQILQLVCKDIAKNVQDKRPLIISIAAGIRSTDIDRWLGGNCSLVRSMPNTPALLQTGATGLYANSKVNVEQKRAAENLLSAAGITVWVKEESQLDAVTAVSGSGPAYFFLLMEAMQKAGEQLGLDAATAQKLTLQTALGAARMATESDTDPATLRTRVTSKGGTTEAAINCFQQNEFETLVNKALSAAQNRATELADILGKDQ
ncbi:MAG: pyrroline-5-carboxylate reductase [Gammaproteobacteria bacterium]|nr:pyrroline-5-carboxylate reductase [Gammaproteobacteria bacterium]